MDKITNKNVTVSVFTLGCKVNLYESRQIITDLIKEGVTAVEGLKKADLFVINTCAVTNEAERKSRQAVSRCKKLNPDAKIIVCGCASQKNADEFGMENVVFVKGNADKTALIKQFLANERGIDALPTEYKGGRVFATDAAKTRAFVKIQDGCNNFCNYCIVPYLRGRSRSRAVKDVVDEITGLSDFKEVVLTGIDISSFDDGNGGGLACLCRALKDTPMRKRLGSLEVRVVDRDLLQAMKDGDFCPHFHLSLQSGSDAVLKSMNRHYTRDEYFCAVNLIREYFPDAGITTDIIVGYPTETERDFVDTCEFAQKVGFDDIHVFPYSRREGTVAAKLAIIPRETMQDRVNRLTAIKNQLKQQSAQRVVGKTIEVLTEEAKGEYVGGYSQNYVKTYLPRQKAQKNKIYKVFVTKRFEDGVTGDII